MVGDILTVAAILVVPYLVWLAIKRETLDD